jgi:hypothetical protein
MGRKVAVTFILGLDCMFDLAEPLAAFGHAPDALVSELPAPIFALEAPVEAWAHVPFSVNAWVGLSDLAHAHDEVLPDSFKAVLDPLSGRIVVTGRLRRRPAGPMQAAGPHVQRALVVGIQVVAPAGMYALEIPPTHYAASAGLPLAADEAPLPLAKQWLHVRAG